MVADPDNHGPDLAGETDELRRALTPTKERAIIALLNEQTLSRAAETAEISQRTLYRWLRGAIALPIGQRSLPPVGHPDQTRLARRSIAMSRSGRRTDQRR